MDYTHRMPSKIPPTTVRLGVARKAALDARAQEEGTTPHALIIRAVDTLLGPAPIVPRPPAAKEVLALAEAKAAHLAAPKKRPRRAWSLKGVHLGPVDPPLGSRLKGTTPGKAKR